MLFHSLHAEHRPDHFECAVPHAVQEYCIDLLFFLEVFFAVKLANDLAPNGGHTEGFSENELVLRGGLLHVEDRGAATHHFDTLNTPRPNRSILSKALMCDIFSYTAESPLSDKPVLSIQVLGRSTASSIVLLVLLYSLACGLGVSVIKAW